MDREVFENLIKQSPRYWRLIFCYGPNVFMFDASLNEYSNLAIQIAYEFWLRSDHE